MRGYIMENSMLGGNLAKVRTSYSLFPKLLVNKSLVDRFARNLLIIPKNPKSDLIEF